MRVRVIVIFAVLVVLPQVAAAGGVILELEASRTRYGEKLGRHLEPAPTPGDGGFFIFGVWHRSWDVQAVISGHDAVTVNGAHDDNFVMEGIDVRRRHQLAPHLDLTLRVGAFHAGIYGVDETPLERYRGGGVRGGIGLRYRLGSCDGAEYALTTEIVRNNLWLASPGAKDIRDHTTHLLFGFEVRSVPKGKRRCRW